MKKIAAFLLTSIIIQSIDAQSFIQAYKDRADLVTQTQITSNLQEFSNLGVKTTGSQANTNALNWLKNKYLSYGYTANQMAEDPFSYGNAPNIKNSTNLVITKTGTVYPDQYVIICGHYDTIVGPGVSDNGSGTSILLEAARILKDVPTEYSIKFIHFSGEEQGLIGSTHYANTVAYQGSVRNLDIKLVLNIDQVGGKIGNLNNTITCERDTGGMSTNNAASNTATQELAACTGFYSPLQTSISYAYSSDYMPFEAKGYTITGLFEYIESGNQHTVNDTMANVDPVYVLNVGKAAVGALQHFAIAATTNNVMATQEAPQKSLEAIQIYPNPAKDMIMVELPQKIKQSSIEVSDMTGKIVMNVGNQTKINVSGLQNGVYMVTVKTDKGNISRKVIIEK
ncbi:leucyl aminopeptidase [Chryseobacterium lactis]|uniref:Leucyl aminopeptidase n=1 Tax=Chryseobacterium lactis TaxID=1241981 RepID=A0A3G6RFV0_CHRLC|nr:M28 family peptidase [Chryseobacterium lactis]AZA83538.1 M28 family peptidase [Chryseobacterium lactis]AZB03922.1 M28 family peptidase [Chryseobacterium lactis]PNW13168.1 leucyl aminopeptidase [Chryseobacterium lactis]